jgi:hypothetical protein
MLPRLLGLFLATEDAIIKKQIRANQRTRGRRARSPEQMAALKNQLSALLSLTVQATAEDAEGGVYMTHRLAELGKAPTRYDRLVKDVYNDSLIYVADVLRQAKALTVQKGEQGVGEVHEFDAEQGRTIVRQRYRTRVALHKRFLKEVVTTMNVPTLKGTDAASWSTRLPGEEVVLLKNDDSGELVDYLDNPVADRWRANVRDYARALNEADVTHKANLGRPIVLQAKFVEAADGAPFDSLGGRLYGTTRATAPFYYPLSASDKLRMQIFGNPVVHLDFKAFGPVMAYHLRGINIDRDPYAMVPGYDRAVVKAVMNAMLSAKPRPSRQFLGDLDVDRGDRRWKMPRDEANKVAALVEGVHEDLRDSFWSSGWKTIQNREVKIVLGAALHLLRHYEVLGLTMHDSLYVAQEHEATAHARLVEHYKAVMGFAPLDISRNPAKA